MELVHTINKETVKDGHQQLTITFDGENPADCSYDDFEFHIITRSGVINVTQLMWSAGVAEQLIDEVNWVEKFANQTEEVEV